MKFIITIISLILIDQVSKFYVIWLLNGVYEIELTWFLNLSAAWNYGVSFGMFNNASTNQLVFIIISLLIICTLIYCYIKKIIGYYSSFIIGGALSNCIDRVVYGCVFDFIDFNLLGYHYPTFNVADSVIVLGSLVISLNDFYIGKNEVGRK